MQSVPAPYGLSYFADPDRIRKIETLARERQGELEGELRALGAPGFAWGLVMEDGSMLSGAEGTTRVDAGVPVTSGTSFRIGSITKVFTALALLQLRDEGRLDLDTAMRRWLPELDGLIYPSADSPLITPRQVIHHRSGLPRVGAFDYTDVEHPPSEQDVLTALDGTPLVHVPGVAFEYSNFGYSLLGLLITRAARQPFDEYISEHILRPLGMSHSVWSPDLVPVSSLARPHAAGADGSLHVVPEWQLGASAADGGIYSSVEDLARFVTFQLSAWPASSQPDHRVLARSTLREAQSFQTLDGLRLQTTEQPPAARASGAGFGWAVYRDCRFPLVTWHNGGTEGHGAAVYLLPTRGVGVILLANRDGVDLDTPARHLLARLHDAGVLPERTPRVVLSKVWIETVEAVLALRQNFSDAGYKALFYPATRQVLTVEKMRPFLENSYREFGVCHVAAALDSHREHWVAAQLACERGEPQVLEAVLAPNPKQLLAIWTGSKSQHDSQVQERIATAGAALNSCGG